MKEIIIALHKKVASRDLRAVERACTILNKVVGYERFWAYAHRDVKGEFCEVEIEDLSAKQLAVRMQQIAKATPAGKCKWTQKPEETAAKKPARGAAVAKSQKSKKKGGIA